MHRSSECIASLAAALAKAQAELINPEKSLIGSIKGEGNDAGERLFRYASLASGLDIVRKTLGQHEIATVQTTAIDRTSGTVNLTTMLAHASGQWIASDWPVCALADWEEPHRAGMALTYARRYGLFTLVGIAGEDDLDAPDLATLTGRSPAHTAALAGRSARRGNGSNALQINRARQPRLYPTGPMLSADQSAAQRDQLLVELKSLNSPDTVTAWAQRILSAKNRLTPDDAQSVETAFQTKLATVSQGEGGDDRMSGNEPSGTAAGKSDAIDKSVLAIPEPRRIRDKKHLRFVAKQPCLRCGRRPSDPHHLRFAQNPALGRKVSDEFTVPLCRGHHRELHRCSDEAAWWAAAGIDALGHARALWRKTHPLPQSAAEIGSRGAASVADARSNGRLSRRRRISETKPIPAAAGQP